MSRYIDAECIRNVYADFEHYDNRNDWTTPIANVLAVIDDAPSIEIVFCKDCRECVEKGVGMDCPSGYGYLYCRRKKSIVNEDDHCSWGRTQ